ncbi:MAG: hypothetical protein QOF37_250 [Thermoleophilaceae bacterium]|nr:hypothetical protein [Thermoleophilaceae bacterium]
MLGRDVSSGRADGMPLLRAGTGLTPGFKDALTRAGVHAVYIEDEASCGIDPRPLLSDETRAVAAAAVGHAFETAKEALATGVPLDAGTVDQLEKIARRMAEEVAGADDAALAIADLSTADAYTLQHSINAAALGLLLGQRIFRDRGYFDYRGKQTWEKVDARLTRLGVGLLLHDVGKLAIPGEILNKPGRLDPAEWAVMKTHPIAGVDLLRSPLVSVLVKAIVRSHHERWDGEGYPDGKADLEIHELARIAAVADVYDAATSERVYARARPAHEAVRIVREGSGTAFDPEVVDVFSKLVAPFPAGASLVLADGREGVVVRVPPADIDRPVVRILSDGEPYDLPLEVYPEIAIAGWEPAEAVTAG